MQRLRFRGGPAKGSVRRRSDNGARVKHPHLAINELAVLAQELAGELVSGLTSTRSLARYARVSAEALQRWQQDRDPAAADPARLIAVLCLNCQPEG